MKSLRTYRRPGCLLIVVVFLLLAACSPQTSLTTVPGTQERNLATPSSTQVLVMATPTQAIPAPTLAATKVEQAATEIPSQASSDPCAYLTVDEVTQVTGETIVEAVPRDTPRPNCKYQTKPDASSYTASIVVYVFTDPSAAGGFEIGKTAQDENTQPVTGVGDDAYWSPSIKTLNVLYKNIYFTVQFLDTKNQTVDIAKELALKLISHL